jgi:signal transduction histidine kinase/ActR/RegA family two-component response regulator
MTKQISLKYWFNKHAKTPVLIIIIITITFQVIYTINARKNQLLKRKEDISRLIDIANIGILSNDRAIIETTLNVITNDMGAKRIFFCKKGKLILSYPAVSNFDCSNPEKAKVGEEHLIISPKGNYDSVFYFYFTAFNNVKPILLMLSISILFSLFIISILQIIQRRIREDLIRPIETLATKNIMLNSIKISELNDIANKNKLLSELREAEALAKQAQFMAHDIRRPFSQIKIILSMFHEFNLNHSKLENAKHEVDASIKNVESMLSDLIESKKDTLLNIKKINVDNLIEQSLHQLNIDQVNNQDILVLKTINKSYMVFGDEQKLTRSFVNILENAIDAMKSVSNNKEKWTIEISSKIVVADGTDYVQLTIGNNGPSINNEDLNKLFEPFFTKGKKKGTGLGLNFVHRVISTHKGTIKAINRINKNGVDFIILLPLICSEQKNARLKETMYNELSFLILDDDQSYRLFIKEIINTESFFNGKSIAIFEASNVQDAIKITERENIMFAVVDFELNSDEKGIAYIEYINKNNLNTICLLHTNRYINFETRMILNKCRVEYIPKPMDSEKLLQFLSS